MSGRMKTFPPAKLKENDATGPHRRFPISVTSLSNPFIATPAKLQTADLSHSPDHLSDIPVAGRTETD